jgi:hypothetical protein
MDFTNTFADQHNFLKKDVPKGYLIAGSLESGCLNPVTVT